MKRFAVDLGIVMVALLFVGILGLVGAGYEPPVSSISFDGGKTELHGKIVINLLNYDGAHAATSVADSGEIHKVTIVLAKPPSTSGANSHSSGNVDQGVVVMEWPK